MKPQFVTQLPPGYDDRTAMELTPSNHIVITNPAMPPLIFDETELQWVPLLPNKENNE